jgi:hypothetical protein
MDYKASNCSVSWQASPEYRAIFTSCEDTKYFTKYNVLYRNMRLSKSTPQRRHGLRHRPLTPNIYSLKLGGTAS